VCRLVTLATVLALALTAPVARASIILNTLQGYDWTEPGWSGGLDTAFSASGGNTEKVLLEGGGRIQWLGDRDRWRLQVSGSYEESQGIETARSIVAHLRQNHRLGERLATVAFAQRQHNPFQRLKSRWLLGAGLRYDVIVDEDGRLAVGATPMLEIERLEGESGHRSLGRLSTFVLVSHSLREGLRLDGVGFFQPAFADLADFRASANLALVVKVTAAVDLRVGASVEHDDSPPAGVEPTDWDTTVGFSVRF